MSSWLREEIVKPFKFQTDPLPTGIIGSGRPGTVSNWAADAPDRLARSACAFGRWRPPPKNKRWPATFQRRNDRLLAATKAGASASLATGESRTREAFPSLRSPAAPWRLGHASGPPCLSPSWVTTKLDFARQRRPARVRVTHAKTATEPNFVVSHTLIHFGARAKTKRPPSRPDGHERTRLDESSEDRRSKQDRHVLPAVLRNGAFVPADEILDHRPRSGERPWRS